MLQNLLRQIENLDTNGRFTYSVAVADNDANQSAKSAVSGFAGLSVTYCVEERQNIALARNKAISAKASDFIAFIDDDELPPSDWLLRLFNLCETSKAAGVLGPVHPRFEVTPPNWLLKGRFYERPTHPTGSKLEWRNCRTGNVLFRRSILDGVDPVFRPEYGSGGEDRDFFRRMIERGHTFVWCDEAAVHEIVPAIRWDRKFMLKRALLRGKMSLNETGANPKAIAKSVAGVLAHFLALPFAAIIGQHRLMRHLISLCDHAGKILAALKCNPVKVPYVTE
jgi:glycosyltransferase involved in cell wall biosynthesis